MREFGPTSGGAGSAVEVDIFKYPKAALIAIRLAGEANNHRDYRDFAARRQLVNFSAESVIT